MDRILGIHTEEIEQHSAKNMHFHRYEPTPYSVLDILFNAYPLTREDSLVDYGCGLGRIPFYANHLFHCLAKGVEIKGEYYKRALKNASTFRGEQHKIRFFLDKAEGYEVLPEDNYFYFFNPFSDAIFKRVLNQIMKSLYDVPREVKVILFYPEDEPVFYMEQHTNFVRIDELAASSQSGKDRRDKLVIYQWAPQSN